MGLNFQTVEKILNEGQNTGEKERSIMAENEQVSHDPNLDFITITPGDGFELVPRDEFERLKRAESERDEARAVVEKVNAVVKMCRHRASTEPENTSGKKLSQHDREYIWCAGKTAMLIYEHVATELTAALTIAPASSENGDESEVA